MATDKKISELPVSQGLSATDVSVLVKGGVDYQYSISLLLQYVTSNLSAGATISFGEVLPQNSSGKNGDVFLRTTTGQFAQKFSGTWSVVYTPPSTQGTGTTLYGTGSPGAATGKNSDSYIDTLTGVFYLKSNGIWSQVFSMQTGPAGPKGEKGDVGLAGADGRTILNGSINPANFIGNDGDFYINTSSLTLFGPKNAGTWSGGINLVNGGGGIKRCFTYDNSKPYFNQFNYDETTLTLTFMLSSIEQQQFPFSEDFGTLQALFQEETAENGYKPKYSFEPIITTDGINYISVMFEGVTDPTNAQIILS